MTIHTQKNEPSSSSSPPSTSKYRTIHKISSYSSKTTISLAYDDQESVVEKAGDHLSDRIFLFYGTSLLLMNRKIKVEIGKTEEQIGQGSKDLKTQAAHKSHTPSIHVIDQAGNRSVFLKNTYFYTCSNSTDDLPDYVNTIDSYLEKKTRDKSIDQLNDISNKNSLEAIEKETLNFISSLQSALAKYKNDGSDRENKLRIVAKYKEVLQNIKHQLEHTKLFDYFLGAKVGGDSVLKEVVFQPILFMRQEQADIEATLMNNLLAKEDQFSLKKPTELNHWFRQKIFLAAPKAIKIFLAKFFNVSIDVAQSLPKVEAPAWAKNVNMQNVLKEIRNARNDLVRLEFSFRSKLFRSLRAQKKLTQKELVSEFKQLVADWKQYSYLPMSQSTVSRLESLSRLPRNFYQRPKSDLDKATRYSIKNLDQDYIEVFAVLFDVPSDLFLAALLSSEY